MDGRVNAVRIIRQAEQVEVVLELNRFLLRTHSRWHSARQRRQPSIQGMPAVDHQVESGHVVRRGGGEKDHGSMEIFWALDVSERSQLTDPLPHDYRSGRVHRGEHIAGAEAIHIDVEAAPFGCQRARHVHDARLRGIVRGVAVGDRCRHRGDVDDLTFGRLLADHLLGLGLSTEERAGQVHGDDLVPIRLVDFLIGPQNPDAGVIDGNVEPPKTCHDLAEHVLNLGLLRDIATDERAGDTH